MSWRSKQYGEGIIVCSPRVWRQTRKNRVRMRLLRVGVSPCFRRVEVTRRHNSRLQLGVRAGNAAAGRLCIYTYHFSGFSREFGWRNGSGGVPKGKLLRPHMAPPNHSTTEGAGSACAYETQAVLCRGGAQTRPSRGLCWLRGLYAWRRSSRKTSMLTEIFRVRLVLLGV